MTSRFIYSDLVAEIRDACARHLDELVTADNVQLAVRRGEIGIVALQERDIRAFLMDIENQIELVKFTVDDDKQLPETKKIAKRVLLWLREREERGGEDDSPPFLN